MSVQVIPAIEHDLPQTRVQRVVGKACQYFLYLLCAAPIAIFPIGLVCKALAYFFP
jgi:hypothetical protein